MKLSWEGTPAQNVRFNNNGVISAVNIFKNQGVITWVRGYKWKQQGKLTCEVIREKSPNAKAEVRSPSFGKTGEIKANEGIIYYGDTIRIVVNCYDNLNKVSGNLIYTYLDNTTKTVPLTLSKGSYSYEKEIEIQMTENNVKEITIEGVETHVVGWHDAPLYVYSSTLGEADTLVASDSSNGKCYTRTIMYTCDPWDTTNTKPSYNAPIRIYGGYVSLDDTSSSNETLYVGTDKVSGDKSPVEFTGGTFTVDVNYRPSDRDICTKAVEIKDARTSSLPYQLQITHHKTTNSSGSKVVKVDGISITVQIYY